MFRVRLIRGGVLALVCAALGAIACPAPAAPSQVVRGRLRADGQAIVYPNGAPFVWRGATAFRLVDLVANGREEDAIAFLDWAHRTGFDVVRVLATLCCWFDLPPDAGRRALPRVLDLARDRGLYVQVVALAGTAERPLDLEAQARAIGRIASSHDNAIVEIANEPYHPTQDPRLRANDYAFARRLGDLLPDDVLYTIGAAEADGPAVENGRVVAPPPLGEFITRHLDRRGTPREMIAGLRRLERLSEIAGRPVLSGEPIGAAESAETGRRLVSPDFFFAYGVACRLLSLACNFHFEAGLQAAPPSSRQQAAADAFIAGTHVLPDSTLAHFAAPDGDAAPAVTPERCLDAVTWGRYANRAIGLVMGSGCDPAARWSEGWRATRPSEQPYPGVMLLYAGRSASASVSR